MRPRTFLSSTALLICLLLSTQLFAQRDYAANVTIARDTFGVPHIYGKTDADAAYGLAWAHCEDDFKTLNEMLILIKGHHGRTSGVDGATTDFFVHSLGAKQIAEERYEKDISPEFREYLEGFAAGINDYAKSHKKELTVKRVYPVTPVDIIQGYVLQMTLISDAHKPVSKIIDGKFDQIQEQEPKGSNAFAFSPNRTTNGNTMLCVNPHVPFEGFFSWYEAHMKSDEGLDMIGALLPGGVSLFLGTNQNLGWAHTWNGLDLVDVYHLTMHPKKKNLYWLDGRWHKLETGVAKLRVKLKKWLPVIPVRKKTYWSKYGPTYKSKNGEFYSIRFGANQDIRVAEQWFKMTKAKNLEEFREILKMGALARFNIVYADKEGHIFYVNNGMIPKRNSAYNWTAVVPGDTSATLWTNLYEVDSLPMIQDPDCGYVYNVNNTPYHATCDEENIPYGQFATDMGFRMGDNNRSMRFQQLMRENQQVDFETMKKIKWDNSYPDTSAFINSIMVMMDSTELSSKPELNRMKQAMRSWDREADPQSVEATWFLMVFDYVFKEKDWNDGAFMGPVAIEPELFEEALQFSHDRLIEHFGGIDIPIEQVQRIRRGDSADYYMPGFPDALAANYSKRKDDGTYEGFIGDAYTLVVEYDKTGPIKIETLHPLGASARPESKHYTDQMPLFSKQTPKPMTMDWDEILKTAERVYHPGE